jgi:hypothetical protein
VPIPMAKHDPHICRLRVFADHSAEQSDPTATSHVTWHAEQYHL